MGIERYREALADRIVALIVERCGADIPLTVAQMESAFPRFGARLRWVARDVLPEPMYRNGWVFMPDARETDISAVGRSLARWMAHELAEVVLDWPGTRAFQGPGWNTDRHRIATLVEARLLGHEIAAAGSRC